MQIQYEDALACHWPTRKLELVAHYGRDAINQKR